MEKCTVRALLALAEETGVDPTIDVDTDVSPGPLVYEYAGMVFEARRVAIAGNDTNVAVDIPASCVVLLTSDVPVSVKLDSDDTTVLRTSLLVLGAEDANAAAIPATSLILNPVNATAAVVRLVHVKKYT